jgi:hypothetical protein
MTFSRSLISAKADIQLNIICFNSKVSLDSRVREVIDRNMVDPTPYTFNEAQLQIYTLMHRDSYPRFLNSPIYKKLISGEAVKL